MAKQIGMDLDNIRSSSGSDKKISIAERVMLLKFPEKKWVTLRLYGAAYSYAGYWVNTKKKDGTKGSFFVDCPSYDPVTQLRDSTIYDPWRDVEASEKDVDQQNKTVKFARSVYFNGIFRSAQKQEPSKKARITSAEKESGIKEKDSDSWTPVYACRFTASVAAKIKEQSGLNVVEVKGQTKAFPVTHEKYGCDIRILYDTSKSPGDQYQISIGERSPISEEEQTYLLQDLSELVDDVDEAEVKRNFESWAQRIGYKIAKSKQISNEEFDDDEDDEEEEEKPKAKSKSKPVAKSKKPVVEDDDDFDDEEEDDEEDEKPSKKAPKGKAKPVVEEDDDDDEDDFGDDEEDDEPKPKAKTKAKPVVIEEEDDDEEDDFDDEPAPKAKGKAKPVVEEDDDFDDDEEDEPKPAKKPVKGKAKPAVEEDDDFDDDEEEVKPVVKAKAKAKAKPVVEEDEEEEEEEEEDDDDFDDEEEAPKSKAKVKPVAKAKAKKVVEDDDDDDFN